MTGSPIGESPKRPQPEKWYSVHLQTDPPGTRRLAQYLPHIHQWELMPARFEADLVDSFEEADLSGGMWHG